MSWGPGALLGCGSPEPARVVSVSTEGQQPLWPEQSSERTELQDLARDTVSSKRTRAWARALAARAVGGQRSLARARLPAPVPSLSVIHGVPGSLRRVSASEGRPSVMDMGKLVSVPLKNPVPCLGRWRRFEGQKPDGLERGSPPGWRRGDSGRQRRGSRAGAGR